MTRPEKESFVMMNKNRRFSIADRYSLTELAEKLTTMSWCLCNGFLAEGLLLLNDAFSEDGAQEFAVFRCPFSLAELEAEPRTLDQLESLTCSWMTEDRLRALLYALAGKPDEQPTQESEDFATSEGGAVVIACSVGKLTEALHDGVPQAPQVLATHPIKTHPRRESCHHCA
jgi:hypothetical protein